jgi:hypothetical protein
LADARFLVSYIVAHEATKDAKNPISPPDESAKPALRRWLEFSHLHVEAAAVAWFRGGAKSAQRHGLSG